MAPTPARTPWKAVTNLFCQFFLPKTAAGSGQKTAPRTGPLLQTPDYTIGAETNRIQKPCRVPSSIAPPSSLPRPASTSCRPQRAGSLLSRPFHGDQRVQPAPAGFSSKTPGRTRLINMFGLLDPLDPEGHIGFLVDLWLRVGGPQRKGSGPTSWRLSARPGIAGRHRAADRHPPRRHRAGPPPRQFHRPPGRPVLALLTKADKLP